MTDAADADLAHPPQACFRRAIDVSCPDRHRAIAWMEDDFHHFGVCVWHDRRSVERVSVISRRAPFSTCPAAAAKLQGLAGRLLVARASDIGGFIDMREQCTHMFDLAGLAVAAAFAGRAHRTYIASVTDRHPRPVADAPHTGRCTAVLHRDGAVITRWDIIDQAIQGPSPLSLRAGFRAWTESLPEDDAEADLVLRRAIEVAAGRVVDLEGITFASELGLPPACHTYRPDQAGAARRNAGTQRHFPSADGMLANPQSQSF